MIFVFVVGGNSEFFGIEIVNVMKFMVDVYGRLINVVNVFIVIVIEGSKYFNYDVGIVYVRYDII